MKQGTRLEGPDQRSPAGCAAWIDAGKKHAESVNSNASPPCEAGGHSERFQVFEQRCSFLFFQDCPELDTVVSLIAVAGEGRVEEPAALACELGVFMNKTDTYRVQNVNATVE